jgi:hypothetical protein
MKIILTTALTAALLLGGAPLLASAQTQAGPVHVDKVQIYQQYMSDDQVAYLPGFADVAFTNDGNSAATDVQFAVLSDGALVDRYDAIGSYAPGVTVKSQFPDEDIIDGDQSVEVAKVTFADGTVWTNADLPPAAPAGVNDDASTF